MRIKVLACILLFQAAVYGQNSHTQANDLGFTYTLPADWDAQPVQAPAASDAKGLACAQMVMNARHGTPASIVAVVALPYACYGQEMTPADLAGFGAAASESLRNNFELGDPLYGAYSLGSHTFWIERIHGSPKAVPNLPYTMEIACAPLKKAAVCWLAMAADPAALSTFEQGQVSLDGGAPTALVPTNAFDRKP